MPLLPESVQRPARPPASLGLGSFLRGIAALLDQWPLLFGLPLGLAVLTAVVSLLMTPYYRAHASFIVDSDQRSLAGAGGLAGIASQFGINVGQGGSESPTFYGDLARTDEVLLAVATARYPVPGRADSLAPLWAMYRMESPAEPRWREVLLKRMRSDVQAEVSPTTGIVVITVDTPDRALSAAVADSLLSALNRFNLERRQLRSRESRRFLESRVTDARADLRQAEDSLRIFRQRNRLYQQDPDLSLRDQRLQREVDLRQQIYVTLSSAYEQARIEEVRDTPALTVVDPPLVPFDKVRPRRRVLVLTAAFLGLAAAVGVGLLRRTVGELSQDEQIAWAEARSAAARVPIVGRWAGRQG